MPTYVLSIKAELENVASLLPLNNVMWKFDIVNASSERKEGVTVCATDELELSGSRGHANFVMKWPGEKHESYIKIVHVKKVTPQYGAEDSGSMKPILGLECRGLEIERWIPGDDFVVESTSGVIFENVDLTENDWADYDERNDESVSITDLEYRIEKH
mmetsp:Transcript_6497/g.10624  ORF Transcript_6497/g.10624 Transcript_6497/m.10624 type:complete len:159 (-) Transcript_6497:166-642(-)|eukprot:CAMPEP_0114413000 /NCGR_PEP_ID=MMETSP0103-20121206/623_1 /TAXON_ID=37642 ORGANISM="Paraphysomonas imperforata, Strain PA2" /NCGR_SAMPLE_ID=MMETSP0103 /ASSEMBLY_ACC=CAM_ASM_000201 /LENGTH=158 /DNA_ID=CAMNT_0001581049 /DNA_START=63 /DNA_END=539 /DNA_ORIENTATION=+